MNYVGKLLSNFKGFYNEINSATLTGAIDVLIIKQEDGSYVSSPFHVRFGKMGVLRSREKIVDIEINGEAVDLQMKLGEAGEAFFVHEAQDEYEIPAYLATSPICSENAASLMEQGISRLREESMRDDNHLPPTVIRSISEDDISVDYSGILVRQSASQTENVNFRSVAMVQQNKQSDDGINNPLATDEQDDIATNTEVESAESELQTQTDPAEKVASEECGLVVNAESGPVANEESGPVAKEESGPVANIESGPVAKEESGPVAKEESGPVANEESGPVANEESGPVAKEESGPVANEDSRLDREDSKSSLYYSSFDLHIDSTLDQSVPKSKVDMAVQTDMSGAEIESKATERLRTISNNSNKSKTDTPPDGTFRQIPHITTTDEVTDLKTIPANSIVDRLRSRDSEASLASLDESKHSYASQASAETVTSKKKAAKKLTKKRPEKTTSGGANDSESSEENVDYPEGGVFGIDIEEELSAEHPATTTPHRSGSLDRQIEGVDKQRLTEEWATSQFASSQHPWSDADITPIMSPVASRPPSPKSDTELYEVKKLDSSAQTLITGTGEELNRMDDISWAWGQLPETVTRSAHDGTLQKDSKQTPGGLFQFMRKTKKLRHQPEKEGVYLDDLNLNEMDPEIAALYLYGNKSVEEKLAVNVNMVDEDTESGRGASLPQSPVSMDMHSNAHDNSAFRPVSHQKLPEVVMSLCGGLAGNESDQKTITAEKFSRCIVSYDDFSQNPAIINDSNLVIKLNDKYYNWQMAGPMVMSFMCFDSSLSENTVDSLIRQHLPQKESRRRGWFMWGRGSEEKVPPPAVTTQTPTSSPASSSLNSPQKWPNERQEEEIELVNQETDCVDGEELKGNDSSEEDPIDKLGEMHGITRPTAKRPFHKSSSTSNFEALTGPQKKYAKSLKLNSQEIEKLHLREGYNTAMFSVTTQYQGTAKCDAHIYLWNWDDKLIISDIDGTITRSDVLGHVLPLVGKDWSQMGITSLYNQISNNGYKFVYLSARAIGQSTMTRAYLRSVTQENNQKLPEGPLLLSPSSLVSAFHKEVIEKKPQEFKIGCLKDIRALFPVTCNPFVAGFGNKINDVWAYREVDVPISRIFTVNHRGELRIETVSQFSSSYSKLSDIVDMFFPPIFDETDSHPRKFQAADYSSFQYWREPMPDIEGDIEALKNSKI